MKRIPKAAANTVLWRCPQKTQMDSYTSNSTLAQWFLTTKTKFTRRLYGDIKALILIKRKQPCLLRQIGDSSRRHTVLTGCLTDVEGSKYLT